MEEEVKVKPKHKKYKYSPVRISIIIVVGFIIMVILLSLYSKSLNRYLWLSCTYNSNREEYSEKLRFKFLAEQNGKLYEYYRDEVYTYTDSDNYDKVYEYLVDYKDNLGSIVGGDNIVYDITKKSDTEIGVETYINVGTYGSLFGTYMEKFELDKDSTIEEVYNTLVSGQEYTCKVTESK